MKNEGGKALPILGIVCGVFSALMVSILTGPFTPFVALGLLAAVAILLFMESDGMAKGLGGLAALCALLSLLWFAPLHIGGQTLFDKLPEFFQDPWLAVLLAVGTVCVIVARKDALAEWVPWATYGVAIARIVLAAIAERKSWADPTTPVNLVGLLMGLLLAVYALFTFAGPAWARASGAGAGMPPPAAAPAKAAPHPAPHKAPAHAAPKKK